MTYGCKDRPPFRESMTVQAGWYDMSWATGERAARWKQSPFRMAKDCQYTLTELGQVDAGCAGCKHKTTIQKELI